MDIWNFDKASLFILLIVPGFVSMKAYQLVLPSNISTTSDRVIDAVSYSCINYALLYLPMQYFISSHLYAQFGVLRYIFYMYVLFANPILLVLLWKKLRCMNFIQNNAPHPTLKPWDYVFSKRKQYWIKVVLKDGTKIAGRYGEKSFASSYPAPEQIYLEETWILSGTGAFERQQNDTAGVIVLSNEIAYVELRN